MPEQDPIDELRAAWQGLEAPQATPDACDAETEALVRDLRAAWDQLEAPPSTLPWRMRLRHAMPRSGRGIPDWISYAAAAAALILFATLVPLAPEAPSTIDPLAEEIADGGSEPEGAQIIEHRIVRSVAEDALVMEYGTVQLVLLTTETTAEFPSELELDKETSK